MNSRSESAATVRGIIIGAAGSCIVWAVIAVAIVIVTVVTR